MATSPTLIELLELSLDPYAWQDGETSPEIITAPATPSEPTLSIVPKRTLRDSIATVDYICDTIEQLDDAEMSDQYRDQLTEQLITALAGTRAKVDATCGALATFESLAEAAKAERIRLEKREAYFARQTKRLETHVLAVLQTSKLTKVEGDTSTLALRKNPPKVVIDEACLIPAQYLKYKAPPPPEPDKTAIGAALKSHQDVPGAKLESSFRLVRS